MYFSMHLGICLSISVCLPIYLPTYLSAGLSLSVCLSACLLACLSICLPTYLSIFAWSYHLQWRGPHFQRSFLSKNFLQQFHALLTNILLDIFTGRVFSNFISCLWNKTFFRLICTDYSYNPICPNRVCDMPSFIYKKKWTRWSPMSPLSSTIVASCKMKFPCGFR